MDNWRNECRDLRVIFNETELFQAARFLALSLGFEAFVFALAIPATSLHRPLFRLYGAQPFPVAHNVYDAMRRATRGSISGLSWSNEGAREACTWLATLPPNLSHGWSQPTRSLGTELGIASFARSYKIEQAELDALELKMISLAQTLHAQLMNIIIGRGDLFEPLSMDELTVLRWAAQGKTAKEIAQLIGVEDRRVIYLTQLARSKMRASTTIQAAVRAQGYGLF